MLAQDPLPSVRNVFAFVRREELCQATMMAVKFHKGSAMVAGASSRPLQMVPDMTFCNFRPPSVSPRSKISGNRKCTYYNDTNHIRETYFKLNGYSEWFVQKNGTQTKGNNSGPQAHHISIGSHVDQFAQQVSID